MAVHEGWIFRRALLYRGAIQEEDERAGRHRLMLGLLSRSEWTGLRYPTLRMGVRSLPHGSDSESVQAVRQRSANLAERDPAFQRLRAKIHGSRDARDAARVRDYAAGVAPQGAHLPPKA